MSQKSLKEEILDLLAEFDLPEEFVLVGPDSSASDIIAALRLLVRMQRYDGECFQREIDRLRGVRDRVVEEKVGLEMTNGQLEQACQRLEDQLSFRERRKGKRR